MGPPDVALDALDAGDAALYKKQDGVAVGAPHAARVLLDDGRDREFEPLRPGARHSVTHLARADYVIEALLFVMALGTRMFRIDSPMATVFDEVHFGRFVSQYDLREYFFDIHPPLAKLTLYFVAKLFGFSAVDRSVFKFQKIGAHFPPELKWFPLRTISAVFGALHAPLMYRCCRKLAIERLVCIMAAFMINFDMVNVIESRLILTDSQLLFYCGLALYFMLELWDTEPYSRARAKYVLLAGLACGGAISVKYTGLGTPGVTGLVCLFGLYFPVYGRITVLECVAIGAYGLFVFMLCFQIHFLLLPNGGDGDGFMPTWFRMSLVGDAAFKQGSVRPWFPRSVTHLAVEMVRASARIKNTHNWASMWYSWPLTQRGILYFVDGTRHTHLSASKIYLIGNLSVYACVVLALIVFGASQAAMLLLVLVRRLRKRPGSGNSINISSSSSSSSTGSNLLGSHRIYAAVGWFCTAGWLVNMVPYLDITRATFLYHYLPALWYGIMLAAWMLHVFVRSQKVRVPLVLVLMTIFVANFVYFAPWVYNMEILNTAHKQRQWFSRWN
ncbi:Dolichyl-phosphate-mannose--protein mannosyltransferase 1 [Porphyridium purpureum]|uniref:Dolichyl-phosphate-mannose--protein mannosyltransferase 1 n=1 Tax=Porphyridium purpureum TaxID=35688 RepID=A0A5J4YYG7_PORPP|nr:Dolichyl-phosphate-mannose--protein mannosyltransferase 1 [Porphyridium purpureum]|eukprot:POR0352..scf209_3